MWFIIDDQMADDRRIRRLPLATVGLWVKLCVIHSKGVSMQSKDPSAYPGHFDQLDLSNARRAEKPEAREAAVRPPTKRPSKRRATCRKTAKQTESKTVANLLASC